MGLFYGTQVTFVGSRIGNVKPGPDTSTSWNAHTWEVK
jgi:hypothetical protein